MSINLVLTVIGDDQPGLIESLSATISGHHGNWQESSMSHLAGKFAGILRVSVPGEHAEALKAALATLTRLKIVAEAAAQIVLPVYNRKLTFNLVGHDRIGIVREVTQVLARHAVNVEQLTTFVSSAPMSGEPLFHAQAELQAHSTLDARQLKADLELLSNDLVVDVSLDEIVAV